MPSSLIPRGNILNPAQMDDVAANDTVVSAAHKGSIPSNKLRTKATTGLPAISLVFNFKALWNLEDITLGQTFTHFPGRTASKKRIQGNEFAQSVMFEYVEACGSCHDVHGTENYARFRNSADKLWPAHGEFGATHPP